MMPMAYVFGLFGDPDETLITAFGVIILILGFIGLCAIVYDKLTKRK